MNTFQLRNSVGTKTEQLIEPWLIANKVSFQRTGVEHVHTLAPGGARAYPADIRFKPDFLVTSKSTTAQRYLEVKTTTKIERRCFEHCLSVDSHTPVYFLCGNECYPNRFLMCRASEIVFGQPTWIDNAFDGSGTEYNIVDELKTPHQLVQIPKAI